MTDNPTLFTEVRRRAEERRAALKAIIEEQHAEVARHKQLRDQAKAALAAALAELAMLEFIVEPLAGAEEQKWTETEHAQPWCKPEQHKTRRNLPELVLAVVDEHPGQLPEFLADILTKRRRIATAPERINEILRSLQGYKVECRDERWYPLSTEHPGREKTTGRAGGDEQETTGYDPALVRAQLANMPPLLSEPSTAPSTDHNPAEMPPEPEAVPQECSPSTCGPTPEVTLDFIRRARSWLSGWQLQKHTANLEDLVQSGAIERREDGKYRYVNSGEEMEAATAK